MTDGSDDHTPNAPPFDELKSKRFGRHVREAIRFREEMLSRDPDSAVAPEAAAAILGWRTEDIDSAMDEGRLGFVEVDGERIIRVLDLQAAFDEEHRRHQEFADDWMRLSALLDFEE